jgi:hypothetical protein
VAEPIDTTLRTERDLALRSLHRARRLVRARWSHGEECGAEAHADCGPAHQQLPGGSWGVAWRCYAELTETECKRTSTKSCTCGLGPLLAILEAGCSSKDEDPERDAVRAEGRFAGLQEARDLVRRAMGRNLSLAAEHAASGSDLDRELVEQRRAFAAEDSTLVRDLEDLLREVSRG